MAGVGRHHEEERRRAEEERRRKEEAAKAETARQRQEQIDRKRLEEWLATKKFHEFVIVRDGMRHLVKSSWLEVLERRTRIETVWRRADRWADSCLRTKGHGRAGGQDDEAEAEELVVTTMTSTRLQLLLESTEQRDTRSRPRECDGSSTWKDDDHDNTNHKWVGGLTLHHPAWMECHAGGSRSIPTVHQRRQRREAVGSPRRLTKLPNTTMKTTPLRDCVER